MKSTLLMVNQQQQRPIVIVGGAVGDIVLTLKQLPSSGQDIEADSQGYQIGGCAFNIARVLRKLELNLINGISVGNDSWGRLVEKEMKNLDLPILLRHENRDNGWCLALVEPSGERSFITIGGCETDWEHIDLSKLPVLNDSIVYVSGYELAGEESKQLQQWLLALPDSVLCFIDPGPRITDIDSSFFSRLLTKNILLTLNRDEIILLCGQGDSIIEQVQQYLTKNPITIIARLDSHGAWICRPNRDPVYIPANQVEVVDTIGAGDSHCGGVIAGLALGLSLEDAVRLGNQIAAIVVNRRGANNPPTRAEFAVFEFMEYE